MDLERFGVNGLYAGELEGDVGVFLRLKEVGRAKVVVAHLRPGVDAGDVNLDFAGGLGDVVLGTLEVALERVELSTHGGNREMLGGETNVGMRFVDLVSDHLVLLVIFLMAALTASRGDTCLRKQLFRRRPASAS